MVNVKGTDGNLWREVYSSDFRDAVDGSVATFQPLGQQLVFVLGTDGNLWSEQMGYAPIVINPGYIAFPSGIALGGTAQVVMWPNGNFAFTGSLHNSGAAEYDDSVAIVLRASNGEAFTFTHQGTTYGTFESGSRDDTWSGGGNSGVNPQIAASWSAIAAGYAWTCTSQESLDLGGLVKSIEAALTDIGTVITVAGPVLAAL
jgi:hypothetical protein